MTNGTRSGWGVSVTPRPLFTPEKDPLPIVQVAGRGPRPVWTSAENLAPSRQDFDPQTVQPVASRYTDSRECIWTAVYNIHLETKIHQILLLRPDRLPEKVEVNSKELNKKIYSHKKKMFYKMPVNQPKKVKSTMRNRKLRSSVNW